MSYTSYDDIESSCSGSTINALKEIKLGIPCNIDCSTDDSRSTVSAIKEVTSANSNNRCKPHIRNRNNDCYNNGFSHFTSMVIPLSSPNQQGIEFRMRRKNKTVTLQWQPFSGAITQNGIAYLSVVQTIYNTPPYPISIPIYIIYKNIGRMTNITIDNNAREQIKFYLNTDGSSTNILANDNVRIPGGAVTWIVD